MCLPKNANILLVEDNPIDVRLTRLALKRGGFTREPVVLDDGLPAIQFLRRDESFAAHPFPDLVILDLNLTRVDGPAVLAFIRNDLGLDKLCVAVLSSSPEDVMISRAAGANCYFSKPSDLESYMRLGEEIAGCCSCNSDNSPVLS